MQYNSVTYKMSSYMLVLFAASLVIRSDLSQSLSVEHVLESDVKLQGGKANEETSRRNEGAKAVLDFNEENKLKFLFGSDSNVVRPHLQEMVNSNASINCKNDTNYFIESLKRKEKWAIRMLDATAKIPAGIQNGNFLWYGSFEECLQVKASDGDIHDFKGQYCMASFIPTSSIRNPFKTVFVSFEKQLQTSPFSYGVCLPSSCSSEDLERFFYHIINKNGLNVSIHVSQTSCQTQQDTSLNASAIIVIIILISFGVLVLISTLLQFYKNYRNSQWNESTSLSPPISNSTTYLNPQRKSQKDSTIVSCIFSFSLIANVRSFLNTSQPEGTIGSLHGLRVISMLWIVLLHTYSTSLPYAWRNFKDVYDMKRDWTAELILNGNIAVDTFFFLSGFLVCYVTIRKLQKTSAFGLLYFYIHRYWRLTPVYAIVIAVAACLFPYLGSGPHWPDIVQQSQNCQKSWWANLLYISNVVEVDSMCQFHCWFLSADMQLYILSPLIIYPLFRWPKLGISLAIVFVAISIAIDSTLTYLNHLPATTIVLAEEDLDDVIKYSRLLYMMPYMRFGPYCVGILIGYLAATGRLNFKMRMVVVIIGWAVAIGVGMAIIFGLYRYVAYNMELSPTEAILYSSLSRPAWGLALAWIVIACYTGHGGFIDKFLSWKLFIPWGRLTYCGYIIHYNLLVMYYASRQNSMTFDHWTAMYIFIGTVAFANALALPLFLIFEFPMIKLERIIMSWYRAKQSNKPT